MVIVMSLLLGSSSVCVGDSLILCGGGQFLQWRQYTHTREIYIKRNQPVSNLYLLLRTSHQPTPQHHPQYVITSYSTDLLSFFEFDETVRDMVL